MKWIIILVFETSGRGSTPLGPAKFMPRSSNGRALLLHGRDGSSILSRGTNNATLADVVIAVV